MDLHLLIDNLSNPALLFFFLGILATQFKSDLEIPEGSSKFISLYLLLSIGFKGGQELSHSQLDMEIFWSIAAGIILAIIVPLYTFYLLRRKFNVYNSGAIAASYGSVSAVTFVTAISFCLFSRLVLRTLPYQQPCVWQRPKPILVFTCPWRWPLLFPLILLWECRFTFISFNWESKWCSFFSTGRKLRLRFF
jgi:hypothetical protein